MQHGSRPCLRAAEKEWGDEVPVDQALDDADPKDYDALVLPGGVINPDALRMLPEAVAFVKAFFDAGKPVGAICHGPWTVVEAGAARDARGRGGQPLQPAGELATAAVAAGS